MPPAIARRTTAPNGQAKQGMTEGTSPFAGLRSRFLDSRSASDQLHIFDVTARTAQELHRWAARYPLIRRVRVWPLALSVAAAAPFCSVDALITTARWNLWAFTLDDLFDEERVPQADLLRRTERYQTLSRGNMAAPPGDSLASALCEIRDDLARYSLFNTLRGQWADALSGTIEGMRSEYSWRLEYRKHGEAALPTYADYLATGRYSIGGPPHVWVALIAADDPSTPQHIDHLQLMEHIASTCIRLANDLQSYRREIEEGKINALGLLVRTLRQEGHSEQEAYKRAEAMVRQAIADGLAALGRLQQAAKTKTAKPPALIADLARFVCDFYDQHDYHTFVMQRSS